MHRIPLLALFLVFALQLPAFQTPTSQPAQPANPQAPPAKAQPAPVQKAPARQPAAPEAKAENHGQQENFLGFVPQRMSEEQQWEQKFRAEPKAENLREYMQRMTLHAHAVGQPYDKDNAEWILSKFKEWGLDAHIENFDVLFPTPKERVVEMVAPKQYKPKLFEPPVEGDPTSAQQSEQLPTYNAYSPDGDVTADLVYVNYGMPDDYDRLQQLGVDVKGKIIIARYGGGWRGLKPKVGAEHGAIGCIIYSDPAGDGYTQGEVFPKGAYRPPYGVQRGSVMDTVYPGDPLTPGEGSVPGTKRLTRDQAKNLPAIPVLPMSYADAQPLLEALGGPVAPEGWRGTLPITYHVGPGPAKVHLKISSNWDTHTLYDVIAKIPGSEYPDQWVMRGNHHDAWVYGAEDPTSGAVAVMEEARAMAQMVKQGWRPKRTLIYMLWDGEEPGLLGSTEWAETHAADLKQHAVAYVNSDSNGRGYFYAEGSHSLEKFINDVARSILDPETKKTVWERSKLLGIKEAETPEQREEVRSRPDQRIEALGDGSDYTTFLDHLGIASLNIGYGGEDGGGIYHSVYDDFYWYTHFDDTDFKYGVALAQTGGTAMMRLASADVIPFEYGNFADTMQKYVDDLRDLLKTKQAEAKERNLQLKEGVFTATADPKEQSAPPPRLEEPPYINFAPLLNATRRLTQAAKHYDDALDTALNTDKSAQAQASWKALNARLVQMERLLTDEQGLPRRPWFKHMIYAPGVYTGYGAKPMPGVREGIELKHYKEAEEMGQRIADALNRESAALEQAAQELGAEQ